VPPVAPQAFSTAGQTPALALVGNALDGSSGPWRKEAGGATAAGPAGQAATPPAKPRAQFTALLQSLVETGNAPAVRKAAPAVNKEDAPLVAFWMAAPTATSQASHPAKPADGAAGAEDGAHANDSPTGEQAAAPETSGDVAAPVAKATPQAGAPLPVALATPKSPWPDAPEDGAELPRAAAQAMENGAPDSKLAAGAAVAEQETAGGDCGGVSVGPKHGAGGRGGKVPADRRHSTGSGRCASWQAGRVAAGDGWRGRGGVSAGPARDSGGRGGKVPSDGRRPTGSRRYAGSQAGRVGTGDGWQRCGGVSVGPRRDAGGHGGNPPAGSRQAGRGRAGNGSKPRRWSAGFVHRKDGPGAAPRRRVAGSRAASRKTGARYGQAGSSPERGAIGRPRRDRAERGNGRRDRGRPTTGGAGGGGAGRGSEPTGCEDGSKRRRSGNGCRRRAIGRQRRACGLGTTRQRDRERRGATDGGGLHRAAPPGRGGAGSAQW
jgi:hypothetical protein